MPTIRNNRAFLRVPTDARRPRKPKHATPPALPFPLLLRKRTDEPLLLVNRRG